MNIGDTAPNFILKDETGKDFELYQNLEKYVLLVFYPKDDTPVCSSQLAEYNDNLNEFIEYGIKVIGLNADTAESHREFCSKLKLNFPLLSDENKQVSKQYDALNIFGMNKRNLVLIGKDKKVKWIASTLSFRFIKTEEILAKIRESDSQEMT